MLADRSPTGLRGTDGPHLPKPAPPQRSQRSSSSINKIGRSAADGSFVSNFKLISMSAMNSKKEGAFASEQLPTDKTNNLDIEGQGHQRKAEDDDEQVSAFKSLGWLDRFLALWIILAMAIGIILGNFVPSTGPALEKGKFVGVSVPIGMRMIGSSL